MPPPPLSPFLSRNHNLFSTLPTDGHCLALSTPIFAFLRLHPSRAPSPLASALLLLRCTSFFSSSPLLLFNILLPQTPRSAIALQTSLPCSSCKAQRVVCSSLATQRRSSVCAGVSLCISPHSSFATSNLIQPSAIELRQPAIASVRFVRDSEANTLPVIFKYRNTNSVQPLSCVSVSERLRW